MDKKIMNPKELNDYIKGKLPVLVESFVEVYGERYRERITSRLNNTIFTFGGIFAEGNIEGNRKFRDETAKMLSDSDIVLAEDTYDDMVQDAFFGEGNDGGAYISTLYGDTSKVCSICFFPYFDELSDDAFVHELDHIIQSDLFITDKGFTTRSGIIRTSYDVDFERKSGSLDMSEKEIEDYDVYLGLNEVVNDYLAQKVLQTAKRRGFKLGESESVEAVYSAAFPVVGKFIDENLDLFLNCFIAGKKKEFLKEIGNENFKKLADSIDALLCFEGDNADEIKEKMEGYQTDIYSLLSEKNRDKVPQDLRYYVSLYDNVQSVVDKVSSNMQQADEEESSL